MTIRLRSHHLLCMLTYVGKGYSRRFIENYDTIAARIAGGETIEIIDGPDAICAPLLCESDCHCMRDSVFARDRLAAVAVSNLLDTLIEPGCRIVPNGDLLTRLRAGFASGDLRAACHGCQWFDLCSEVARSGYRQTRIRPSAGSPASCS